jgi:hypothetical protein
LVILLAVPLVLAEVKVAFIYLVIALFLVYRRAILRNPLGFLSGSLVVGLVLAGGLLLYQEIHWGKNGRTFNENVEHFLGYSFEKETSIHRYRFGYMTRREAIEYWAARHDATNVGRTLFGHGFGSARTSGLVVGEAARPHYPRKIDSTGLSSLLWEFGVIGTVLAIGALISGFLICGRLCRHSGLLAWEQSLAGALQVLFLSLLISLPYRNDIPYAAPCMFLLMSGLGLTLWLCRRASGELLQQK